MMRVGGKWLALAISVGVASGVAVREARAGYEDDKNNQNLGAIERAMAKAQKNPAV